MRQALFVSCHRVATALFSVLLVLATALPALAQHIEFHEGSPRLSHLRENPSHAPAPDAGTPVVLDEAGLLARLRDTPRRSALRRQPITVRLPAADGREHDYALERVSALHPALQARYPELLAFAGHEVGSPGTTIRAEYSPRKGWTAAVQNARGTLSYLAAEGRTPAKRRYRVVAPNSLARPDFACHTDHDGPDLDAGPAARTAAAGDCQLRQYSIAITCTGEYAQAVDGPSPTTAGVLAAMNVAVNRVNEVYERDLGVTFEIVANNDELLFFNGATDPYTEGSPGALINESQTNIDALIGANSYDVGHIFSTEGGGLAQLRVPCTANRARGVTGIPNPTGDGFYIDYVAHEIGHQFGATHTYYNSCGGNRSSGTAYEPGSGSTIMAYAGICSPNVQNRSDDYFHAVSIEQISSFITGASGNSCATILPTANAAPVITATPDYSIPVGTAFELTAEATDPDGDVLTYTWEQFDNVLGAPQPPQSTNVEGPLFRSIDPSTNPTRRFPSGDFPGYEVLPTVERDLNFRLTVRDNNGQVGCTAEDDLLVQAVGSTPFRITNYDTPATLTGFGSYTVTWDVAGTTAAPFNAAAVDVFLSLDGGRTYDFTLLASAANTGSATVTLPNVAATGARFVVKAADNIFLDVNDADLTIEEVASPTFTLSATSLSFTSCGVGPVNYFLDVATQLGFSEPVTLTAGSLPAGVTAAFSANGRAGDFTSTLSLFGTPGLADGTYGFTVTGTSATVTRTLPLVLEVRSVPSQAPQALGPVDGAQLGRVFTPFTWSYSAAQGEVRFQLSQNPSFPAGNTFTRDFAEGSALATGVSEGIWFWRVAYVNDCGVSAYGPLQSFQRIPLDAETFTNATAVPIGDGNGATYTSTVNVDRAGTIYQVEAGMLISHTYVGDLDGAIALPGNLDRALFDRPLNGSCREDDLSVLFADDAVLTPADFTATCTANIPSISGTFTPIEQFYTELPREALGDYTLTIEDNEFQDGGAIDQFAVTLYYADLPEYNEQLITNTLRVPSGQARTVAATNLRAATATVGNNDIVWVVKEVSALGELKRNDVVLGVGASFTQRDIDDGLVAFLHDASSTGTGGQVTFDLVLNGDGYRPNLVLPIEIITSTLQLSASVTSTLACFGDETAQISATASGGTPPYQYTLGTGQTSSTGVFDNLPAGDYTVTVRDADDFVASSGTLTVASPDELTLGTSVSGSVVVATGQGGTGALSYQLDGGPVQSGGTFTNVANGVRTVTVVDANGCTTSAQVVVSTNALIAALAVEEDIDCNGDRGVLLASAAGGTAPYTYALNGGAAQSDPRFANLGPGSYTVTVTDATGATASSSPAVVLTEPAALSTTASVVNSAITLSASGGTAPYGYSLDGNSYQASPTFSSLANGTYTLFVRDANGCTATAAATVSVNNLVVQLELVSAPRCNGDADGSVQATASGGTSPYTYALNGGAFQTSGVFGGLAAGSYTVTARDANGLEQTSTSLTVTDPSPLTLAAQVSGAEVTLTAAGGTSPYTYSVDGGAFQAGNTFGPLAQGPHQFVVRDANGCEQRTTATVDASDLAISIDFNLGQETCPGAEDGAVTLMGLDGTAPYEFSIGGAQFQSGGFFGSLAPGNYTATVRDATGATATAAFEILERVEPTVDVSVAGSRVTLANFSPAASNVRYSFDGGDTFTADPVGFVYAAGTTDVLVRYGACELVVPVTVSDPLTLEVAGVTACADATDITTLVCVSGGVVDYRVTTSSGTLTAASDPDCDQAFSLEVAAAVGQVTVTLVDDTDAQVQRTVSFDVLPAINVGGDVDGDELTVTVNGGTAPFTYSIDGGATSQASAVFTDLPDGDITVLVVDAAGCTATQTFTVSSVLNPAALGLRVFPNPADAHVTVVIDHAERAERYVLIDVTGRVVLAKAEPAARTQLDVARLPAGYYTLSVEHPLGATRVPLVIR